MVVMGSLPFSFSFAAALAVGVGEGVGFGVGLRVHELQLVSDGGSADLHTVRIQDGGCTLAILLNVPPQGFGYANIVVSDEYDVPFDIFCELDVGVAWRHRGL